MFLNDASFQNYKLLTLNRKTFFSIEKYKSFKCRLKNVKYLLRDCVHWIRSSVSKKQKFKNRQN